MWKIILVVLLVDVDWFSGFMVRVGGLRRERIEAVVDDG